VHIFLPDVPSFDESKLHKLLFARRSCTLTKVHYLAQPRCKKDVVKQQLSPLSFPPLDRRSQERKLSVFASRAFHCNGQPAASRNYHALKNRTPERAVFFTLRRFLLDPAGTQPVPFGSP
jgi:hypothetical protein